ncbi:hypothetical protein C8R43DRAFT_392132 [Mycena crocata]|nr:hypothetical protein C8R43DRAFT_392132 [Mycena crocata]
MATTPGHDKVVSQEDDSPSSKDMLREKAAQVNVVVDRKDSKLSGFFRCTDILHHYHQSLTPRDGVQLQKILSKFVGQLARFIYMAILGHDAILHPRHPLAAEGTKGIQGYVGTFSDGQAKLLFSSKQVEYLRYWMKAMMLTPDLIPLPYSDCMFVDSDVTTVSPTVLESLGELSATSKKLGRMNQYLKENPLLVRRRVIFEHVRTNLWNAQKGVWCAVNFAAWEVDHTAISDVGWSLIRWENGNEVTQRAHLVVKENQTYKKTQVEEGGEHETVTKATLKRKINDLFTQLRQHEPVFLVSNDIKGDLKYLRSNALQVPLDDAVDQLPATMPSAGVFLVDPVELFQALSGNGDAKTDHELERVCKHLQINLGVRNAGTDAQCILQALRSMASGPQLDAQREERWPGQTELQVQFKEWENDPKYADLEGVVPPVQNLGK